MTPLPSCLPHALPGCIARVCSAKELPHVSGVLGLWHTRAKTLSCGVDNTAAASIQRVCNVPVTQLATIAGPSNHAVMQAALTASMSVHSTGQGDPPSSVHAPDTVLVVHVFATRTLLQAQHGMKVHNTARQISTKAQSSDAVIAGHV